MKRRELQSCFDSFYSKTYPDVATDFLKKTGDFLNAEDFLTKIYYEVYKAMKKLPKYDPAMAQSALKRAFNDGLARYWKKHRKDLQPQKFPNSKATLEQTLETDFDLTEESAEQEMLSQDILEYVSGLPALIRRSFVLYFYFEETPETIAAEMNLSSEAVISCLQFALKKIRKNILDEYL